MKNHTKKVRYVNGYFEEIDKSKYFNTSAY